MLDFSDVCLHLQLALHIDGGLLHRVDAEVRPAVGLLLDIPDGRHARLASSFAPLDAVVDQNRNDLRRQAEIAVDREQNFDLLRAEKPPEPPLRFSDHAWKFRVRAVLARHVFFRVARRFGGGQMLRRFLRTKSQLPQACRRKIEPGLRHTERLPCKLRLVSCREVEI